MTQDSSSQVAGDTLTSISVKVNVRQRSDEIGQGDRQSLTSVTTDNDGDSTLQDDEADTSTDDSVTSEDDGRPKVIGKVNTMFWEEQSKQVGISAKHCNRASGLYALYKMNRFLCQTRKSPLRKKTHVSHKSWVARQATQSSATETTAATGDKAEKATPAAQEDSEKAYVFQIALNLVQNIGICTSYIISTHKSIGN